ncbi:hypothetical protein QQ045_008210 [Rhodiola kirilowii]
MMAGHRACRIDVGNGFWYVRLCREEEELYGDDCCGGEYAEAIVVGRCRHELRIVKMLVKSNLTQICESLDLCFSMVLKLQDWGSEAEILSRVASKKQYSLRVEGKPGAMKSISSAKFISMR